MPPVSASSRIELHELVVRPEDGQVIVGRAQTAAFVALPEVGGRALEHLAQQPSIAAAEAALAGEAGAAVDLTEFAENLIELGFVRAVDGQAVGDAEAFRPSFPWLRPRHCAWLFGRRAKAALAVLALATLATVVASPGVLPAPHDFFWGSHTSVVLAVNTLLMLVAIGLHELAHLAAARSVGEHGRFSLGTRLHVLVAQTDVTGLWAYPRHYRHRAYLAGMAWDLILAAVLVLARAHLPLPETLRALLAAGVLIIALSLAGQLQLFVRTDLYFVLAEALRAKNLMEDAASYLAGRVTRSKVDVLRALPADERRKVRRYAWFMVAGSSLALAIFALAGIPIFVELYQQALGSVEAGVSDGDLTRLADGLLTLAVQGGLQVLFLWVLVRNRGARVRAVLARLKPSV